MHLQLYGQQMRATCEELKSCTVHRGRHWEVIDMCKTYSWSDITLLHHPLPICWILLTSAADTVFLNQLPYMAKIAVIVDFA